MRFENVARFGYAHCVSPFVLDWPSNVGEVLIVVASFEGFMYGCLILIGRNWIVVESVRESRFHACEQKFNNNPNNH